MSCFELKTSGLRLFILMLIEAVLSLLSAVIDKSNLAPISGSPWPWPLIFSIYPRPACLSESELTEFSFRNTGIIDTFSACSLCDQQIRTGIIVMYVFEKIIDLYCSTQISTDCAGQKVICSAGLQLIRRRMMQN